LTSRGGTESVKEDAMELKNIAGEKGSTADKAKEAAAALKDPGAHGDSTSPPTQSPPKP
jgi:hypothetical protein